MIENPFRYGGIVQGPYFADRRAELAELAREMENLNRVFLISPRRYGKTCLLFNLMDRLRDSGFATAYLDLNAYPDLPSLASAYAYRTVEALESNSDKLMKVLSQFKRLRPRVSVGSDGSLSAGLEFSSERKEALPALLEGMHKADALAGQKKRKLVIAIDEFSDLPKYDGQSLEKAMRSEIQQHPRTGYIFSGSEETVMLAMARDRRRAFYKLGRLMELGPIEREPYRDFICTWLKEGGYDFRRESVDRIFDLAGDIPYNIQRMCHILWEKARESYSITMESIEEIPFIIARQDSAHYEIHWHGASPLQKTLLLALGREPQGKPFSRDFQLKYAVGPSSSIKASLDSLVKKGILFRNREGTYTFSDTFMSYWIRNLTGQGLYASA